ncbi:MAG: hypothetical protein OEV44_10415 [Spirochaetota bacterium]|nr:hypothetical protein [Spirochaetota bacterium]
MAEFDGKDQTSAQDAFDELSEEEQLEKAKIDSIIDNLLSGIDLPGDKEINRAPQAAFEDVGENHYESEVLEDGVFHKALPPVSYDKRPELKTDKKRRITLDDVSNLFKDLDRAMAGGKPSSQEPIFGKELEQEKLVADLEELQSQKFELPQRKEIAEPIKDTTSFEDELPSLDFESEQAELEKSLPEEDFTLPDFDLPAEEEAKEIEHETLALEDELGELNFEEEEEASKTAIEKDIAMSSSEIPFEIETPLEDIEFDEISKSFLDEDVKEFDQEVLKDFDDKVKEESFTIPEKSYKDIQTKEEKEISPTEFDDLDHFIEKKGEKKVLETKKIESKTKDLISEDLDEIVESEFGDLVPLSESLPIDQGIKTLKELDEGEEIAVHSEFQSIPEMERIETYEPIETPISDFKPVEEDLITKKEPLPQAEKKPFDEPILEDFDSKDFEIPEIASFDQEPQIAKPIDKTPPPTLEKEPLKKEELIFSDSEMSTIQKNLQKLPEPLSTITTDTIIQEKLPIPLLKVLTSKLLREPDVHDIKDFLEDQLGIIIPIKEKVTSKQPPVVKKEKEPIKLGPISKIVIAACIIAGIFFGTYFLFYAPYKAKTALYEAGYNDIQKGTAHYSTAKGKFDKAKGITNGDIEWYNKYAEEYLKKEDPAALYYAHIMLLGFDEANLEWYNQYVKKYLETNKPGQEEVIIEKEKGAIYIDRNNKKTRLLIAELFKKKALWAVKYENWNDVNSFYNQAIDKGYQPILANDPENERISDEIAKTYLKWGDSIAKININEKEVKYKQASDIYNKILRRKNESSIGLYGLLYIYITQYNDFKNLNNLSQANKKELEIKGISQNIVKGTEVKPEPIEPLDEKVLTKYSEYLTLKGEKRRARYILNKVISEGEVYPPAYYYLGQLYGLSRDYDRALESYIKGLFAYYRQKIGPEEFKAKIEMGTDPFKQAENLKLEISYVILKISDDKNTDNRIMQSEIFNNIGEIYLIQSDSLRDRIPKEKKEKKELLKAAEQSFYLSMKQDSNNYKPWKNLGDLAYKESVSKAENFLKRVPKDKILEENTIESIKKFNIDAKKNYLIALNLATNERIYKKIPINKLWEQISKAIEEGKVNPELFYKLGYIFYKEKRYNLAKDIWTAIFKKDTALKFNPTVNFALGNAYIQIRQFGEAERHFKNVIDFYEEVASRYQNNPDPNSLRQNEVFAKLAKVHNNIGVSFHIKGEQNNNDNFINRARFNYYKAREYATKLNNNVFLQAERLNSRTIYPIQSIDHQHKTVILKDIRISNFRRVSEMLIDDIEPFLRNN